MLHLQGNQWVKSLLKTKLWWLLLLTLFWTSRYKNLLNKRRRKLIPVGNRRFSVKTVSLELKFNFEVLTSSSAPNFESFRNLIMLNRFATIYIIWPEIAERYFINLLILSKRALLTNFWKEKFRNLQDSEYIRFTIKSSWSGRLIFIIRGLIFVHSSSRIF